MYEKPNALIVVILGAVSSILLAANIFFVKRLVDELDATQQMVWSLRQEIVVLKFSIEELRHKNSHQNRGQYDNDTVNSSGP